MAPIFCVWSGDKSSAKKTVNNWRDEYMLWQIFYTLFITLKTEQNKISTAAVLLGSCFD